MEKVRSTARLYLGFYACLLERGSLVLFTVLPFVPPLPIFKLCFFLFPSQEQTWPHSATVTRPPGTIFIPKVSIYPPAGINGIWIIDNSGYPSGLGLISHILSQRASVKALRHVIRYQCDVNIHTSGRKERIKKHKLGFPKELKGVTLFGTLTPLGSFIKFQP